MSAVLLPLGEPLWAGGEIDWMVPPQMVRRRGAAEYCSAPWTVRPSIAAPSLGNAADEASGRPGHIDEIAPPEGMQALPLALVTFQVARKS